MNSTQHTNQKATDGNVIIPIIEGILCRAIYDEKKSHPCLDVLIWVKAFPI